MPYSGYSMKTVLRNSLNHASQRAY